MSAFAAADAPRLAAQWIARPGVTQNNWEAPVLPAPLLRREFNLPTVPAHARVALCGLGYGELHVNGHRVGDAVLDPVPTVYDRRVRYVVHEVTAFLRPGANVIGVLLGNGLYNCHTPEYWHFDKASWRDYPKLWLVLEADGETLLRSGPGWRVADSPIRFDGLRHGETHDARAEQPGWDAPGFDAGAWAEAAIVAPPGGVLERQTAPPCQVMDTLPVRSATPLPNGDQLFDFGQALAGWLRLRVRGEAGAEIVLRYGERLHPDGSLDSENIGALLRQDEVQTDRYILKGGGPEVWEPRFTYHGFRYVQASGLPEGACVDARVVHSAFAAIGEFACSDDDVNRLQHCTLWSYRANFVGLPTDCPHREKNGWTGDAQLATETGLWNYAAADNYREWLATMRDCQRPSGQFPGIVPSAGWGYNWGNGPAWDGAIVLIPWYLHLYTGDDRAIRENYDAARRYVDFCAAMAVDGRLDYGLGDWCHPAQQGADEYRMVPAALPLTAYHCQFARLVARFADLLGRDADRDHYAALAASAAADFNRHFYRGDGIYADGEVTAMACALHQELVPESEREATVAALVRAVEAVDCRADFGILGAKYVPRALADHGRAELAWKLLTQPEFPGWVHWLRQGATSLWEDWGGRGSRLHIMFGDIGAWFYQYLAGIAPDPAAPGFARLTLRPRPIGALQWARASHQSPRGLIRSHWQRTADGIAFEFTVPAASRATAILPGSDPAAVRQDGQPRPDARAVAGGIALPLAPGSQRFLLRS